jgi:hypothetical protein
MLGVFHLEPLMMQDGNILWKKLNSQIRDFDVQLWNKRICATSSRWWLQDENIMRKKYHNQMEDMKGKIRVFARVRPILNFETQRGATNALIIPDVLSLHHMWKDKKREYNFDAVFEAGASQDTVTTAPHTQPPPLQSMPVILSRIWGNYFRKYGTLAEQRNRI